MNNLHVIGYEDVDGSGRRVPVKQEEMFIWAVVDTATGEVNLENAHFYEDEFHTLVKGYEWRKFKVAPV